LIIRNLESDAIHLSRPREPCECPGKSASDLASEAGYHRVPVIAHHAATIARRYDKNFGDVADLIGGVDPPVAVPRDESRERCRTAMGAMPAGSRA
jgi:hypothetical protein